MNEGYVKLFRQMISWEWYLDTNVKCLFIHCLIKANWEDKNFKGKVIPRGSFLTSYDKLSKELKLSVKQIRIALNKLKRTNEVASVKLLNGTLITVLNYETYQSEGKQEDSQGANKGQTKGKQRATTKNIKNYKEVKEEKNKYGLYKHVLLTSTEYNSLQDEYGNADELITFLDEYIEMTGKKYKSSYLAIRKWVVGAVKERNIKIKSKKIDILPAYYTKNQKEQNAQEDKLTSDQVEELQKQLQSLKD
ncbi:MAG: hypothetical protein RR623_10075 [Bacilli bacterium]